MMIQDPVLKVKALEAKIDTLSKLLSDIRVTPMKERAKLGKGLLYEADVETDIRVAINELRKERGQKPVYFTI